ncbi:VacJ family lipoprotein [Aliiglaciecola sp. 3_MG-2023]|uniref:MlaA family lipoprotein n=1 Tax=Aliiglaciecola sp. 3_MG-2023 TaxID=3062644 RepID=UPI0026E4560B|nr:VacJ family lipoprotein [Aliiglaciecola sp. 3_MG-2023]MDO6694171.1 VacJ family lipoprotein [Aliiglaciecola sp. 3_MG-2023]
MLDSNKLNPLDTFIKHCCLISFLIVSGCSSNNAEQVATTPSNNQEVVINTSQGEQVLTPTVVTYDPVTFEDPLESINRPIFAFNDVVYRYFLIPVSKGYDAVVPDPVQTGIGNFFSNLREPLNLLNNLAQGEGKKSGTNLGRFLINSTVGLLGLFDPADAWFDMPDETATIGDTLASYDVGYGNYLVLPILGQSDFRNAFSTIGESLLSPVHIISDSPESTYLQGLDGFNDFVPTAPSYEELRLESDDPYTFFRNMYLQSVERDAQFDGAVQQLSPSPANSEKNRHQGKNVDHQQETNSSEK